jgi:hypothetical protein
VVCRVLVGGGWSSPSGMRSRDGSQTAAASPCTATRWRTCARSDYYAASRQTYLWCRPPQRGSETTLGEVLDRQVAARAEGLHGTVEDGRKGCKHAGGTCLRPGRRSTITRRMSLCRWTTRPDGRA